MGMSVNLTTNALAAINRGDVNSKPLVQVLDIKPIGSAQERYRLLLSDSILTQHAMLATQLNEHVKRGRVKRGSVVQLIDYICSNVQDRKVIVVLNFEIIIPECDVVGNPKPVADMPAQKIVLSDGSSAQPYFRPPVGSQNGSLRVESHMTKGNGQVPNQRPSFRPVVQPPYQPPPSYKNNGAIMKNVAPARVIPISVLNPYQGRWAIKARVTARGEIRRYNNARGDGKVFSFDLLDSDGGEIRATCFNSVVDRFYDIVEVGMVYVISGGSLKPAQKNFNHLKNEWEIFLESTSTVDRCPEEESSIPRQQFSFKSINEIENTESNAILDVIGIVTLVNPSVPILRKNGAETQKRTLNLMDSSGRSVELTLWGDFCNREGKNLQELVDSKALPVVAVKACKVSDFSGKSLGTISSTQLFVNPDIVEAHNLKNWYDKEGLNSTAVSISRDIIPGDSKNEILKTVSQIKDEGLGRSDKPDWVSITATIIFIKADTFCYTACPLTVGDRQCNKKVTQLSNSRWHCDRCNQEFDNCDYRYLLQIQIQDHTGIMWATAFQEAGEEIMGIPAKELYSLKHEREDDTAFGNILRSKLFGQHIFKLKIKEEIFGDEQRVKVTVVKSDKVNYSSYSRHLLELIN